MGEVDPGAGLRPRPEIPGDVLSAIVAAVDQTWPRPVGPARPSGPAPYLAWRFSGRWWARPLPVRRARPYTSAAR